MLLPICTTDADGDVQYFYYNSFYLGGMVMVDLRLTQHASIKLHLLHFEI